MPKHYSLLKLTIYVATATALVSGLVAIDAILLPFLYDSVPQLHKLQERKPYLIDTVVLTIGIFSAVYTISRVNKIERFLSFRLRGFSTLHQVIEGSRFASDTGLAFVDPDGKIVAITSFLDNLAEKKPGASAVGEYYFDVYTDNLARKLKDLVEQARSTRSVAAIDIPDWSNYCAQRVGPAVLYIAPSFNGETFKGFIVVVRSTADVQSAVNSAIYYQMHYQILFDTVPIGVGVFRPSVASDGNVDGYMLESNGALKKAMEGITLPVNEPLSTVWPTFFQQDTLRAAISETLTTGSPVRCDFFSPALGKHFEGVLAPLPGGRLLGMVTDQTELRLNEHKVLALNDQLQRTLAGQSKHMANILEDIQNFNQATADIVETYLEQLRRVIPNLKEDDAQTVSTVAAGLYQNLNQMLRYHNVANLPFHDTALLYPAEVVTRLLEPLGNRFPDIGFQIGSLPGVVANREILTNILEQLMVSLAQLPVIAGPARIEVGSQGDFLSTNITVSGWGFDSAQIFFETPTERQKLDWTITSDLDLATARRMVNNHGGDLFIGPTPDGRGVELSFSIGSPTR
jgi:hypothetical protein